MSEEVWLFVVGIVPLAVAVLLAAYEVLRRSDLRLSRRIGWLLLLFLVPPIGVGLYVIVRPPRHRAAIADDVAGARTAGVIVDLVERHVAGELTDEDYRTQLALIRRPPPGAAI